MSALELVVRWLRNCGVLRPPQVTPATAKSWVQRTGGLAFGPAEGLPGPSSMASLCSAAPKENLVDVWDPTSRIHLFDFDMTPVRVAGQTLLDLMTCPPAPLWHDHFPWTHGRCPAPLHRNCGRKQVAVGRCRHVAGSAQEQSVRREHRRAGFQDFEYGRLQTPIPATSGTPDKGLPLEIGQPSESSGVQRPRMSL